MRKTDHCKPIEGRFRVLDGNLPLIKGKGRFNLRLSPISTQCTLIGANGQQLRFEDIFEIHSLHQRRNWSSPREWGKLGMVTLGSLLGGVIIVNVLTDADEVIAAWDQVITALELGEIPVIEEAIAHLETVSTATNEVAHGVATAAVLGSILGPAAYGGALLSKRQVDVEISTDNDHRGRLRLPEFVSTFLIAMWQARTKNGK